MARKEPTLGNLDDVQGTWPAPPARPEPDKAAPAAAIPEAVRPARADAPSQPRLAPAQPKLAQPSSTPSEGRRTLPGGAPITTDAGAATPVGTTPARPTNQKYRETTPRTLASAPVVAAMASAANTAQKEGEPSAHAHKPVRATVFGWHGRLRRIPFMVQSAAGILIALVLVLPSYQLMQQALAGIQIMHALGVAVLAIAALVFLISASMRRIHDLGMPAWWLLIPLANLLVLSAMVILPGQLSENRFGPPTRRNSWFTWLAFLLLVLVPIGLIPAAAILFANDLQTLIQ
jgi:uncharacterized membrane protein YhaH (DUF805 family)